MALAYQSPGVYREDVFVGPSTALPTGVPGFVGLATVARSGVNSPIELHRDDEFGAALVAFAEGYLADAVRGFFANGGSRCYVAVADPAAADRPAALRAALASLGPLADLDLVAIPDAVQLADLDVFHALQADVIGHCHEHGDRLAILDTRRGATPDTVLDQRRALLAGQAEPVNGALYYPWLRTEGNRWVPPCGHLAGIFARTDRRGGVFKAPANEDLADALDLETAIGNAEQDRLNPAGVNCLRAFPGRGIRVWGARTLSRDPDWRYISVRRLFLTVGRWIERNMAWAAFEANEPRLWLRIQRELGNYLGGLWRAGALHGGTPAEAFFVRCDAETNPLESRQVGQVVSEIGLAATAPAEFVVVRIIHRAGATANA
ncbi:phage tail sheath subtilisin-like domain-containing protein [Accumulibacter sp.]|uniref:phage tail sheath family protein n=1 Tax=Accumulibacter sp. TaxID=2053492 RepID=UPI0025E306F2|nr:phage tail sheath subtilisin-like domain-containing protein [Accumulibacter sp.]MCM8596509.1 phage tail sheath subtilisin-like domain-containing protein [Accumulibacter sp.]MCM8627319.1 phage tail sheath subtilisin-like domain-containing protein [Accumulibacter sp.]MDS4050657.1 phage tail sheath subtilisin-like domain-containing protein [Accumulibacter sp.]